ncbi:MAG: DUF2934 domain-containing protein [Terriglobales bacterium]
MPTAYHSTTSKRSSWKAIFALHNPATAALDSIFEDFGGRNEVVISRSDLRRLAREPQLDRFVMATIVWGYNADRFQNITRFAHSPSDFRLLTRFLAARRDAPISDWNGHLATIPVKGIGLSTYAKFLNFLSVNVCGNIALILDERVARVFESGVFLELIPLGLTVKNKELMYPAYLSLIHKLANDWRVPAENIEFFLFQFSPIMKEIEQNIRLRAYELYEERGRVDGLALDDWLKAEAEIR